MNSHFMEWLYCVRIIHCLRKILTENIFHIKSKKYLSIYRYIIRKIDLEKTCKIWIVILLNALLILSHFVPNFRHNILYISINASCTYLRGSYKTLDQNPFKDIWIRFLRLIEQHWIARRQITYSWKRRMGKICKKLKIKYHYFSLHEDV